MGKVQRIAARHNEEADPLDEDDDHELEVDGEDEEDEPAEDAQPHPSESSKREAAYRRRAKEARRQLQAVQAELDQLKSSAPKEEGIRALRAELAFVKAATRSGITDPEAAWKLADQPAIVSSWDDDEQTFDAIDGALEKVLARYPYLAANDDEDNERPARVQPPPSGAFEAHTSPTSGKPTNGPKKGTQGIDRSFLEKKYPSLRTRRRSL